MLAYMADVVGAVVLEGAPCIPPSPHARPCHYIFSVTSSMPSVVDHKPFCHAPQARCQGGDFSLTPLSPSILLPSPSLLFHPLLLAIPLTQQVLADGTIVLEDGTRILPDGTRVLPDGTRILADGTM
jgi:hypothetical protein